MSIWFSLYSPLRVVVVVCVVDLEFYHVDRPAAIAIEHAKHASIVWRGRGGGKESNTDTAQARDIYMNIISTLSRSTRVG